MEGPKPNKVHRPQDDERMLFMEMIMLPEEYQLICYKDNSVSPPSGSHPQCKEYLSLLCANSNFTLYTKLLWKYYSRILPFLVCGDEAVK